MSSFASILSMSKKTRKEKAATFSGRKHAVTMVRTIHDVHLPPANEEVQQSLLKCQSTGGLKKIATSSEDSQIAIIRLSKSETDLHQIEFQKKKSDELKSNGRPGLSKLDTDNFEYTSHPESQAEIVPALLSADGAATLISFPSSAVSPLSLDMPMLGPTFGIEQFLLDTQTDTDIGIQSEKSASTSSSPEMWEEKLRSPSSASSIYSIPSVDTENSLSDTKPLERPTTPSTPKKMTEGSPQKRNSSATKVKSVKFSPDTRIRKEDYLKDKPLPLVPPTLSMVDVQSTPHIASLTSKFSSTLPKPPIDNLIALQATEKTLSQAANDLERELKKIGDMHPALRSEQSLSTLTNDEENAATPLNIPPKQKSTPESTTEPIAKLTGSHQENRGPRSRQHRTYKVFPPPDKSITATKTVKIQHNRYNSDASSSSRQSKFAEIENKQKVQPSQPSSSMRESTKIKSSVHLPSLRRPRFNNQSTRGNTNSEMTKSITLVKGTAKTVREEQAALARSTDRYVDAEIAKALNVGLEEDEEEEQDDPIVDKNVEESDWSTMYPLKAVKKLGIPLLTNSHIPRPSPSDTQTFLRQQLPKLDTTSNTMSTENQMPPPPETADERRYPETPDDIGIQMGSFIKDSTPAESPTEEKPNITNNSRDNDKVFLAFDRLETVLEVMSPKSQEVPFMMGVPTTEGPSETLDSLRKQSIYELDPYGSSPISQTPPGCLAHIKLNMPASMTDKVILALMKNVDDLDALFKYAQLNRQFYRVFKSNELSLIKNALFTMNPPAWELREMSPPWSDNLNGLKDPDAPVPEYTGSSYLQHYARDVFILVKLKALIYSKCSSLVRSETIGGLTGENEVRAAEIDEAFWRVWTFCRIFGCGKNREGDLNGQIDWLNAGYLAKRNKFGATVITAEPFFSMNNVLFDPPSGFGDGNGDGLTCNQLYDMLEIWNCLGTFVQGFIGECKEARLAGIFDGLNISAGDIAKEEAVLEEWTHYILTLGPSALIGIRSFPPDHSTADLFKEAKQMGMTKWEVPEEGGTRSTFLREAISRTYESRVAIQQKLSNAAAPNDESVHSVASRQERIGPLTTNSGHNTSSHHTSWFRGDDPSSRCVPPYAPANNEIARTDFLRSPPPRYSITEARPVDTVDKAIHRMVHELGFSERDATWALKITDTGDMLDTNAAVQLLVREREQRNAYRALENAPHRTANSRDDCLVDISRHRGTVSWRWA